jgi:hypothetical protein
MTPHNRTQGLSLVISPHGLKVDLSICYFQVLSSQLFALLRGAGCLQHQYAQVIMHARVSLAAWTNEPEWFGQ